MWDTVCARGGHRRAGRIIAPAGSPGAAPGARTGTDGPGPVWPGNEGWAHGRQVIELLTAVAHDRGATVLMVSHDTRLVPFADRVLYLEDGRLTDRPARMAAVQ